MACMRNDGVDTCSRTVSWKFAAVQGSVMMRNRGT